MCSVIIREYMTPFPFVSLTFKHIEVTLFLVTYIHIHKHTNKTCWIYLVSIVWICSQSWALGIGHNWNIQSFGWVMSKYFLNERSNLNCSWCFAFLFAHIYFYNTKGLGWYLIKYIISSKFLHILSQLFSYFVKSVCMAFTFMFYCFLLVQKILPWNC